MEKDFGIFIANIDGEDDHYLIKAVKPVQPQQIFEEEMHRIHKSYQSVYLQISFELHRYYEAAVQNGDVCDYFAETDGNGIVKLAKSEPEIIEEYLLAAFDKKPSDHDDNNKERDWKKIIRENTELLLDFIEENLEDFVGFDPYADTTGYDLQRAWNEKTTYVYSLPSETIATLADEIRERREDFYCEEGEIVDRRTLEAEKE